MVDFESALALANLTQEEVDVIARHEHLSETVALELGDYLCTTPKGERALKRMIVDELEAARARGDTLGVVKLKLVLRHFIETHPQAASARRGDDPPRHRP